MYRCQICTKLTPPNTPAICRTVLTRERIYYPVLRAHRFRRDGGLFERDDSGGVGWEIVKEILVCAECAPNAKERYEEQQLHLANLEIERRKTELRLKANQLIANIDLHGLQSKLVVRPKAKRTKQPISKDESSDLDLFR